jgi:hypothetical protein
MANRKFTSYRLLLILLMLLLVFICGPAFAQSTTEGTAGANAVANTNTSSASQSIASQGNGNAQSTTTVFQGTTIPEHTSETIRSAPSMSIGSFGTSFSSDNCANTVAGALSVIGFGASGGKAVLETTCAHIRLGYAFGQSAAYSQNVAINTRDAGMAARAAAQQAMSDLAFCTALPSDPNIEKGCENLHLVQAAMKNDNDRRSQSAQYVSPEVQSERVTFYSSRPQLADGTIPSRPAGWTGVAGQSNAPPTGAIH